ncbi:MAG: hypothetical protein COB08_013190 [Rhodobacteraceae bacterium]|nr:hypothetical protein [Paracoccaceae bacterium]
MPAAVKLELPFEDASREQVGAQADVIISITSSHNPFWLDAHVSGGTAGGTLLGNIAPAPRCDVCTCELTTH